MVWPRAIAGHTKDAPNHFRYFNGDVEVCREEFLGFDPQYGHVYVDGSCFNSTYPGVATAGCAALQMDGDGNLRAVVIFSLPGWAPQNAAFAEHTAILMTDAAAAPGAPGLSVVTDCSSVRAAFLSGPKAATSHRKTYAGLWKDHTGAVGEVLKTKAHRSVQVAREQGDLDHFRGNDLADEWAKRAARWCGPVDADVAAYKAEYKGRTGMLKAIAAVLAEFKQVAWNSLEGVARLPKPPKAARPRGPRTKHQYVWCPERRVFICKLCLHFKRKARHAMDRAPCTGLPDAIRALAMTPRGHRLFVCVGEGTGIPLVFCRACGCYSETNFVNLKKDCLAGRSKQTARLRTILAGRHPTKSWGFIPQYLGKPWRLQQGTLRDTCGEAWAELGPRVVAAGGSRASPAGHSLNGHGVSQVGACLPVAGPAMPAWGPPNGGPESNRQGAGHFNWDDSDGSVAEEPQGAGWHTGPFEQPEAPMEVGWPEGPPDLPL